jgi:2-methylisocitrate lyase-like PEP mutase family enzyme
VEFTLYDRPVVLSLPAGFRPWDPAVAAAYRAASHGFEAPADAGAAVREALGAPDARRAGRAALRDLCLSHVGHSGERIVALVLARS